jgi:cytochrome P450
MLQAPTAPNPVFLLGHTQFATHPLQFLTKLGNYGDIARFKIGPLPAYLINNPDMIRQVLVDQADDYRKDPLISYAARKFVGNGLFVLEGETHRQERKLMLPAFNHKHLIKYADVMVNITQRRIQTWQPEQTIDMTHAMMGLTLDIAIRCLFGTSLPESAKDIDGVMQSFQDIANMEARKMPPLPDWWPNEHKRRLRYTKRTLNKVISDIIDMKRRESSTTEHGDDLLSILMQAVYDDNTLITDEQLRYEMLTLFIAGHETTASVMYWVLYLIARHPDVQAKLYSEISTVLQGQLPTFQHLEQFSYLNMVIDEALRLYPTAYIFGRTPTKDVQLGDYAIRKGSLLYFSPFVIQRDSRYFDEPDTFDPERFSPERVKSIKRYTYIPFGSGTRICIGQQFGLMEARLLLATILQKYHLSPARAEEIKPIGLATLRPERSIELEIACR